MRGSGPKNCTVIPRTPPIGTLSESKVYPVVVWGVLASTFPVPGTTHAADVATCTTGTAPYPRHLTSSPSRNVYFSFLTFILTSLIVRWCVHGDTSRRRAPGKVSGRLRGRCRPRSLRGEGRPDVSTAMRLGSPPRTSRVVSSIQGVGSRSPVPRFRRSGWRKSRRTQDGPFPRSAGTRHLSVHR